MNPPEAGKRPPVTDVQRFKFTSASENLQFFSRKLPRINPLHPAPAYTGHERGIQRLIFRYQGYLVIPMLFLEALSLHASSIRTVTGPGCRHRAWEAALLAVHFAADLGMAFLVLPPAKAVVFIAVQQGLLGFYLGCSFAPNHKGMPILPASDTTDFLRRQVLTSRNVRGGWLTDFALGGLNYQIEHRLFPSMPRPNLRRAQPMVAAFCADRDVTYAQTSLLASYAQALGRLVAVGGELARPAAAGNAVPVPVQR
ncbi:MAG TPA: acyl-CoA desaturase [Trebonia sp.]|nr:acyl-CoA desaturase [Trebonia sp.]